MKQREITNFYTHTPQQGEAKQLVILLHGLGSDGRDLHGLVPYLAPILPNAVFVSPDAPFPCDMAPMGYQWFSLQEWTQEKVLAGVKTAAPILEAFIREQAEKHGVAAEKTVLLGFSQGTMMSLYVGPRYPEKLGGVLGYSGALIWDEDTKPDDLNVIPVRLIHGEADPVVPVSSRAQAIAKLEEFGFEVSGHTTPGLPHSIDEEGLKSGLEFLQSVLD